MTFATPVPGEPYTDSEPDDMTAYLRDSIPPVVEVFGAGLFIPPTDGNPFPAVDDDGNYDHEGYKQGGLAFSHTRDEKAALNIHAPIGWSTVYVYALIYAEEFGSGAVRFEGPASTVDFTLNAAGLFELWHDVPFAPAPQLGLQVATMPMTRVNSGVTGNLAEDACVLRVFTSPRRLS